MKMVSVGQAINKNRQGLRCEIKIELQKYLNQRMSSVQKPKSIPPTNQNFKSQNIKSQIKQRLQYEHLEESDSQCEQNQRIVDELFGDRNKLMYDDTEEDEHEEDEDIKRFLEQQVPGLYKGREYEENSDEDVEVEMEKEHNFNVSFSSSLSPQYFSMSSLQKQCYFNNLNSTYMSRMNINNNKTLLSTNHYSKQFPKRKPAIKFNQIVFEVPFNKDQQPIIVKDTPEQEAFIVFDDAVYDEYEEDQDQDDIQREDKVGLGMNMTSLDFDQMGEDQEEEEEQFMRQQILERYCRQRLQYIEGISGGNTDNIFTESDEEDQSSSQSPEQSSSSQSEEQSSSKSAEQQNIPKQNQLTPKSSVQKLQTNQKNWKRNSERQFIDEAENSQSKQSSLLDESSSKQNQIKHQSSIPSLLQTVQSTHPALSDQFLQGIQGRKINPNAIKENTSIEEIQMENNPSQPESQPESQHEGQLSSQSETLTLNIVTQTTTQTKPISTQ